MLRKKMSNSIMEIQKDEINEMDESLRIIGLKEANVQVNEALNTLREFFQDDTSDEILEEIHESIEAIVDLEINAEEIIGEIFVDYIDCCAVDLYNIKYSDKYLSPVFVDVTNRKVHINRNSNIGQNVYDLIKIGYIIEVQLTLTIESCQTLMSLEISNAIRDTIDNCMIGEF